MRYLIPKSIKGIFVAGMALVLALTAVACTKADVSPALKGVYDCLLEEGSAYNEYKSYYAESFPDAKFEEKLEGDKITISASGSEYTDGTWAFVLDGNYICATVAKDDFTGAVLVSHMASAIGDYLGMDGRLLNGYINAVGLLDIESSDYLVEEDEEAGSITFKFNIANAYEMKELDQIVIDDKLLSDYEPLTEDYVNRVFSIGKISMSISGSVDQLTILINEYGELDEVAFTSLKNAVSYLKPNGYEQFIAEYTAIEEAETDVYQVTLNVDDATLAESPYERDDTSNFMLVTFGDFEP